MNGLVKKGIPVIAREVGMKLAIFPKYDGISMQDGYLAVVRPGVPVALAGRNQEDSNYFIVGDP